MREEASKESEKLKCPEEHIDNIAILIPNKVFGLN